MAQVNAAADRSKDVLVGGVQAPRPRRPGKEGGERAVRADPDQPAPARTSQAEKFKDTIEQVRLA